MNPTRIRDLVGIVVVATALSWIIVRQWYGSLPRLEWFVPLSLVLLAAAEVIAGVQLRNRIRRKPGSQPVDPLVAARLVALAKASSLVGAAMAGAWAGLLIYTLDRLDFLAAADDDAFSATLGVVSSVMLVGAALLLEYCCRTPKPPDEDDDRSTSANSR